MSTIEDTLRKAREVQEKFKIFMAGRKEREQSMANTFKQIQKTQQTLKATKETLGKVDKLYSDYQDSFSNAIDSAVHSLQKNVLFNVADPGWKPNPIPLPVLAQLIGESKKVLILTGAGMSAGSGIPTFRGANGFWNKQNKEEDMITPEQILTKKYYQSNEFKTWSWLQNFYALKKKCKINKGHLGLSAICEWIKGKKNEVMLVSQNIDNFHVEAIEERGTKNKNILPYDLHEIHGNVTLIRCDECSKMKKSVVVFPYEDYRKSISDKKTPYCPKCQGKLRPHIMFFDEFYSEEINRNQTVLGYMNQADLVMVIGTALQTGLARNIVEKALERKIPLVDMNIECEIRRPKVCWVEGKAEEVLDKLKFEVWKQ